MPIRAVIFDMDGLMLDTEPLYAEVSRLAGADVGVTMSDEKILQCIGLRTEDIAGLLRSWFGADFSVETFWERCRARGPEVFGRGTIPLKPGVPELLDFLETRRLSKAVATSTRRERAVEQLRSLGLINRFSALAGGDEVSHGKPAPDLYLLAAQRLAVEPADCVALEDSDPGARSAHAAGMRVCVVPDLKRPSPEVVGLALGVFSSLADVLPWLENQTGSQPADVNDAPPTSPG